MKRRNFIQQSTLGGIAVLTPAMHSLVNSLLSAGHEMRPLRNDIGMFTESGGTIGWMIKPDAAVVIDTQFPVQAGHLIEEIQKQTHAPIEYLINTHHHGDHTAGNIAFKGLAKKIVAHTNSKVNQKNAAVSRGTEDKQLYPDTLFDDSWSAKVSGEEIDIHYFGAAHTNGDGIIHFKNANVAHLGDLVFNRRFPYIDIGAGASIENWITVLEKINNLFDNDTMMICGHADNGHDVLIGKEDVLAFRNYLDQLLVVVGKEIKAGKSEEEIMAIETIAGAPEWKGKGIERSLSAAYKELTAQ
jgi:glyoxylase-like metal-dependent hydrolase (beta-lactamase superfamily II)